MKEMRSSQAGGGWAWADGISAGVITLVTGDSTAYAFGTYAHATYSTIDRSSNLVTISGAIQVPTHAGSRFSVCPNLHL